MKKRIAAHFSWIYRGKFISLCPPASFFVYDANSPVWLIDNDFIVDEIKWPFISSCTKIVKLECLFLFSTAALSGIGRRYYCTIFKVKGQNFSKLYAEVTQFWFFDIWVPAPSSYASRIELSRLSSIHLFLENCKPSVSVNDSKATLWETDQSHRSGNSTSNWNCL